MTQNSLLSVPASASRIERRCWRIALLSALLILPKIGAASIGDDDYLPEVMQHLARAKMSFEMGQTSIALAHTRVILFPDGLKVYIDLSNAPESRRGACQKAAGRVLEYWNDVFGSPMLETVDRAEAADVKIVFQPEVFLQGQKVGGFCLNTRAVTSKPNGQGIGIFSATVYARTSQPNGQFMTDEHLANIVSHEFGHVFGLNDDGSPDSLMGPLNLSRPKAQLSDGDEKALFHLRKTALEIQRLALAKVRTGTRLR